MNSIATISNLNGKEIGSLPLIEQRAEVINNEVTEPVEGQGEMILLVDDEEDVCDIVSEVLRGFGYTVLAAYNGEKALEVYKINHDKINLIITDLIMPVMGGLELLAKVRQINENVPVIAVTGSDKNNELNAAIHLEHFQVIRKPYAFDALSKLIHDTISH